MDQEFKNSAWLPETEEIPVRQSGYRMTFAEDLYERPVPVDYTPRKPKKPRKVKKGGVSVVGCIALALVFALLCSFVTAWY